MEVLSRQSEREKLCNTFKYIAELKHAVVGIALFFSFGFIVAFCIAVIESLLERVLKRDEIDTLEARLT